MKMKKINSIGYGGKIIGVAVVFITVIPLAVRVIQPIFKSELLAICAKVSFEIGITILLFLALLLSFELHQDKKLFMKYDAQKNIKHPLENGLCECGSCGNRTVKLEDKSCDICGILFERQSDLNDKT